MKKLEFMMKKEVKFDGNTYQAPEIVCVTVDVEAGFANTPIVDGSDLENPGQGEWGTF